MFYYHYIVEHWDTDLKSIENSTGLTFGKDLREATSRIISFFGEEEIISMYLEPWDTSVIEISEEAMANIKKRNYV